MKFEEKIKATALRKKGYSYKAIQKEISVSRSTLSFWLRDISLSKYQYLNLLNEKLRGAYKGAQIQHLKRLEKTKDIIAKSNESFLRLYKNPLFLVGLSLYWAEGDKHKKEMVKFTNSDPQMISLMMKWFREICRVPEEKFRIALHSHTLLVQENIKSYWSKITGVPEKQFHKTYIKQTSLSSRRNVLYTGTCAIRIHSVELFRTILGWKLALLKNFNISS